MCKVIVTDEDGLFKTCLISDETPRGLLKHFKINPDTKIIYMNGKIVSQEDMLKPIPERDTVHFTIKDKIIMR